MDADDAAVAKRRSATLGANATKGEPERRRAAMKAAWTRRHGKDDAANPHTATPAADRGPMRSSATGPATATTPPERRCHCA